MSDLQKQIKKTIEEVRQVEKIKKHLDKLAVRLSTAYAAQNKLVEILEEEYEDLGQLEKLSLKSLFHKVLGSKKEQMEKERQEYLQASLKYDEHQKTVELLEYEKNVLEEKLNKKGDVGAGLEKLLKKREREIIRGNGKQGKQLLQIQQQMEGQEYIIREVREAMKVGKEAFNVLEQMLGFLRTARNWGRWDMGKGGRRTAHFKHSNIDRARERAYLAQQLLNRFEEELRDIYEHVERLNLQIELDSFSRFMDVFFDNLISDWVIQQKIQNALSNVNAVRDRVLRMLEGLNTEEKNSQALIRKMRKERKTVLSE